MATRSATTLELTGFGGWQARPGDAGYDDARRVFNAMIDRFPALIARCNSAADVVAAVTLARESGLDLSVYGGGHGVTGVAVAEGGLCLDLRGLDGIEVDPVGRTARVEGGCSWGAVDAATQAHGLAVTAGRVSTTGVGGLTLGSGSGWIERKYGFTCDNLERAEVVTADGRQVVASETENPDLFWALRGGGGNFGVVTAFHFRLQPVGPIVLGGMLLYPAAMGGELLRFYRSFMRDAPDEVGSGVAFITAPPADFVPPPARGKPVIGVVAMYVGDPRDGEAALAPLRAFGPPAVDLIDRMPYVALQQMLDAANAKGMRNYWTADFYDDLPDEALDTLIERATVPVSPLTQILVVPGGGAVARIDDDATAFGERKAAWNIHYLSVWAEPSADAENIAYTRAISGAMKPWTTGRVYLNYIGEEGSGRVKSAFGSAKYDRLRAIKRVWDPTNLFHHNQNIPPA